MLVPKGSSPWPFLLAPAFRKMRLVWQELPEKNERKLKKNERKKKSRQITVKLLWGKIHSLLWMKRQYVPTWSGGVLPAMQMLPQVVPAT